MLPKRASVMDGPAKPAKSGGDDKRYPGREHMTRFGLTVNFTRTFAVAAGAAVLLSCGPACSGRGADPPVEIIVRPAPAAAPTGWRVPSRASSPSTA